MDFDKLFVQKKYADQLSLRLNQNTVKSHTPYVANFRCDICGDSATNKFKKRGYLLEKEGNIFYYCHNGCGTIPFDKYLETYHPDLYQQYVFDIIKEKGLNKQRKEETPKIITQMQRITGNLKGLSKVSELPANHACRRYVEYRQIPEKFYNELYYTDKFYNYINSILPNKFDNSALKYEHERLIFPMLDKEKQCFGVIGRAIAVNNMRYLNIKFDDVHSKFYGLHRFNNNYDTYIVEGPIDSLFLPNCLAFSGTDGNVSEIRSPIIILDNQPRNKEVILKYNKYISAGHKIVIWPAHLKSKDINAMILDGMKPSEIIAIIKNNTFSGIEATIHFNKWLKV